MLNRPASSDRRPQVRQLEAGFGGLCLIGFNKINSLGAGRVRVFGSSVVARDLRFSIDIYDAPAIQLRHVYKDHEIWWPVLSATRRRLSH